LWTGARFGDTFPVTATMLAYNSILTYSPPHVMGDCNINIAISRIFKEMLLAYKHSITFTTRAFPKMISLPDYRDWTKPLRGGLGFFITRSAVSV